MVNGLKNAYLTHFSSLLSWFNCLLKRLIFSLCMWKMWMRFSIRIRIIRICAYSAYFAYAWPTLIGILCEIHFVFLHIETWQYSWWQNTPKNHPCFFSSIFVQLLLFGHVDMRYCVLKKKTLTPSPTPF